MNASAFSPRAALVLTLLGSALFIALLWMIGAGIDSGNGNGAASGASKGLDGYAALAHYLDARGLSVSRVRSARGLRQDGLLVLTPAPYTDGAAIERIVSARRNVGPTLVITPKWRATQLRQVNPAAKADWVVLSGTQPPEWKGFADDIGVSIGPMRGGATPGRWTGEAMAGTLPNPGAVLSGRGARLVPLVTGSDGRVLAAYRDDGGDYPALRALAQGIAPAPNNNGAGNNRFPLIFVFEPDLLDNYGFARSESAALGEQLVRASLSGAATQRVAFDLTAGGGGRSDNLLTLAFEPPFLAATICLLLTAFAAAWRAFNRFGPPLRTGRAVAFGKTALIANSAALVRGARRFHLLGGPFADAARERLARALALPARLDPAATEAAIDRALAAREPAAPKFSEVAASLRAARRAIPLLRAAQLLHSIERTLTR